MNAFQKSIALLAVAGPLTFAGAPAMAQYTQEVTCSEGGSPITTIIDGGYEGEGYEYTDCYPDQKPSKTVNRTTNKEVTNNKQVQRNNQSINIQDAPEAAVAPAPNPTAPGRVGDVVVPLPTVGVSAFGSRDNNVFGNDGERSTYGVQAGFSVPLGTGQTRRAADQVIARRDAEQRFQLIQEATYMLQAGVLSEEVHPDHWAALYGSAE